jgi:hypothetical protein
LPLEALELNVTFPPSQNVVDALAVIVGVVGIGFTVTAIVLEVADVQPFKFTFVE